MAELKDLTQEEIEDENFVFACRECKLKYGNGNAQGNIQGNAEGNKNNSHEDMDIVNSGKDDESNSLDSSSSSGEEISSEDDDDCKDSSLIDASNSELVENKSVDNKTSKNN